MNGRVDEVPAFNLKYKKVVCLVYFSLWSAVAIKKINPTSSSSLTFFSSFLLPSWFTLSLSLSNREISLLFPSQKAMKMRNKGKVHPSPCSSSSSSSSSVYSSNNDATFSVLKLLPAAILTIASVLSGEDREVLAYMITRSMKSTNPSVFLDEKNKKNSKKQHSSSNVHKSPSFDCECFDCYTSFWVRWDSSPNRELIHQAIEAFEEHLSIGEQSKKGKNKKKVKVGRRGIDKRFDLSGQEAVNELPEIQETSFSIQASPENEVSSPKLVVEVGESSQVPETSTVEKEEEQMVAVVEPPEEKAVVVSGAGASNHKGLARKVLPDVLGLFNSRLWSLWSPNV